MAPLSDKPELQDDQKFALMKFRRSVDDVLKEEHDDYYLLRFLRARSWNPEAAEKMFRDALKWRQRWDADNIHNWSPPVGLVKYCAVGFSGYDKEGAPVVVVPFAGIDIFGLLHMVSRADLIRMTMQVLEANLKRGYEQSKKVGYKSRQLIVIFDMSCFNLKQYLWRPAGETVIALIKMYEANYPEILKCCYIINAPKVFAFGFNIVKKFLDEYTLSKIMIFKSDQSKWLPKILERIDPSQIPKYYGGVMTDEDGDPKCQDKICWGGKVPKELYMKENESSNDEPYVDTMVKKGSKIKLEFECKDAGCFLRWDFKTFEHDIRFGVKCQNLQNNEITPEIPLRRVSSHQIDEVGFITCQPNYKYTVVFDNTYSLLRNKKIRYFVGITTPLQEIEEIPSN